MSKLETLGLCGLLSLAAHLANGQPASDPAAVGCPCDANVSGDGSVNVIDIDIALNCAGGLCDACVNDCDVNCDGVIDFIDPGVVACTVKGLSSCCLKPTGACTGSTHLPACAETLQLWCESEAEGGTYHGDGSFCNGDVAVAVPAVGGLGLLVIAASMIGAGGYILNKRRNVAVA